MYVLIAITGNGVVSSSRYETLHLCQEARSFVLYGMGTVEREAAVTANRLAREEDDRRWRAAHPPREANTDHERSAVKLGNGSWGGSGGGAYVTSDGLIQDMPSSGGFSPPYSSKDGESVEYDDGRWIKRGPNDIVRAHIIAEVPGQDPSPVTTAQAGWESSDQASLDALARSR